MDQTYKYVILSSLWKARGMLPFNLLPWTLLQSNEIFNDHLKVVKDFQQIFIGRRSTPYRLLRFVQELRLSGIGPSRWLLATFLREYCISNLYHSTGSTKSKSSEYENIQIKQVGEFSKLCWDAPCELIII